MNKIILGTRGSLLALTQTKMVADILVRATPGLEVEFEEIKTRGDRKQGTPEASKGDKKDWIFELEQEVLAESIDIAVHSGKDVPSDYEPGTQILSVLQREDPRDIFIGRKLPSGDRLRWKDVPQGASIGTASLRRQASLRRMRPDVQPVEHRGNVPTRLKKLDDSTTLSGIILAKAGVMRLSIPDCSFEEFSPLDMMPAVNQGILCVQCKASRSEVVTLLARQSDRATQVCFEAERACVSVLGADCKSSVSVFAESQGDTVVLSARVLLTDGSKVVEIIRREAPASSAAQLGATVGNEILAMGGGKIIAACRELKA
ncbi:MAG: hydroxymethylbilane synthase [Deltaproteobacteria bacterium]|nr:hydroxymethylbilane synthase [Deltaproteobacteria bacterium]